MGSFLREGVSGLNPESDVPIPVDLLAVLKTMLPDMISKVVRCGSKYLLISYLT